MTHRQPTQRFRRILAAWIALGYCCLSLLVPFHQHVHSHPNSPLQNTAQSSATPGIRHGGEKPSAAVSAASTNLPCAACEWEAAITAPAIPAFVLPQEVPNPPRIVTMLPCILRAYTLSTSSRGPPQA